MHKKTVMIVEDEPDIIMLLKRSLSSKPFTILEANSGTEALQSLKTKNPDLIILDIMMPDMDGFEVCRLVKSDDKTKAIPVIFLSVRNSEEDMNRGKEAGAIGYFSKPFDPFRLADTIDHLLTDQN